MEVAYLGGSGFSRCRFGWSSLGGGINCGGGVNDSLKREIFMEKSGGTLLSALNSIKGLLKEEEKVSTREEEP